MSTTINGVTITRSGPHLVIKGQAFDAVRAAVGELLAQGCEQMGDIAPLGKNWIATVKDKESPEARDWTTVTNIGLQSVIEGASYEVVSVRIEELTTYGAVLVAGPEQVEDKWVAVVDTRASSPGR